MAARPGEVVDPRSAHARESLKRAQSAKVLAMQAPGRERSVTGVWMLSAFVVALVLALMTLAVRGRGEEGTLLALRLTARWSFLWFWAAYTAPAWASLFGPRLRTVAARAREFGLAFAAAHLTHVALVAWLYEIAAQPPGRGTLEFFGVAVLFTYLLALLSFPWFASRLTPRAVSVIRTVGVEYILLAFLVDFAKEPFHLTAGHLLRYGAFLALCVLAYVLRVAALVRRLQGRAVQGRRAGEEQA